MQDRDRQDYLGRMARTMSELTDTSLRRGALVARQYGDADLEAIYQDELDARAEWVGRQTVPVSCPPGHGAPGCPHTASEREGRKEGSR